MADILDNHAFYDKFETVMRFWTFLIPSISVEEEESIGKRMLNGTLVGFLHLISFVCFLQMCQVQIEAP